MSTRTFNVIAFDGENSVAIAPSLWLKGGNCMWPPYKANLRVTKAVEKEEVPSEDWSMHPCRVLFTGPLESAQRKLKLAEETSDMQSADDLPRIRRRKRPPRRLVCEESSESSGESAEEIQQNESCPPPLPSPPPRLTIARSSTTPTASTSTSTITPTLNIDSQLARQEVRDKRMFTLLEGMQEQLKENNRLLRLILSRGNPVELQAPCQLPDNVTFPLRTLEQLEELDVQLVDQRTMASVVRYMAEYGGSTVMDTVMRTMKAVLSTDVAKRFNFKGTKGKRRFEDLNLTNLMFRCLQINPATRAANRKDMEAAITKWLSGARDRDGGRKRRMSTDPRHATPVTPPTPMDD